jgi:hypothetical protein
VSWESPSGDYGFHEGCLRKCTLRHQPVRIAVPGEQDWTRHRRLMSSKWRWAAGPPRGCFAKAASAQGQEIL